MTRRKGDLIQGYPIRTKFHKMMETKLINLNTKEQTFVLIHLSIWPKNFDIKFLLQRNGIALKLTWVQTLGTLDTHQDYTRLFYQGCCLTEVLENDVGSWTCCVSGYRSCDHGHVLHDPGSCFVNAYNKRTYFIVRIVVFICSLRFCDIHEENIIWVYMCPQKKD